MIKGFLYLFNTATVLQIFPLHTVHKTSMVMVLVLSAQILVIAAVAAAEVVLVLSVHIAVAAEVVVLWDKAEVLQQPVDPAVAAAAGQSGGWAGAAASGTGENQTHCDGLKTECCKFFLLQRVEILVIMAYFLGPMHNVNTTWHPGLNSGSRFHEFWILFIVRTSWILDICFIDFGFWIFRVRTSLLIFRVRSLMDYF